MKTLYVLLINALLVITGCTRSVETQVPAFKAKQFLADTVDLRAAAKNKIAFVSIWSIFCGPCLAELPEVQAVYAHYKSNPQVSFVTLALNTEEELTRFSSPASDSSDVYRKAFKHSKLTDFSFPVLIGTRSPYQIENGSARLTDTKAADELKQLFTFNAIPVTRIYDRQGKLLFEDSDAETSTKRLRIHRTNLIRTIDSLLTL
ncbi:TlpA disulfide reductase family protein [uncultured Spirosoma sp.]|uniref:TlpA family protein disulfide reductase n=1 Tax=uncultured Spirosoma sp. TaxID=278208 RepID=UPI00258599C9|nr:TlpA disulfide reductase family protein [uncultured Spirosoma sp.]